jgi:hypothetical protein
MVKRWYLHDKTRFRRLVFLAMLAPTRLSRRCVHRSFLDIRALQHLRHSYASRRADFAAPHLLIMPQLHVDALKPAVSVLRFFSASCMSLLPRTLAVPLQAVFTIACSGILCSSQTCCTQG